MGDEGDFGESFRSEDPLSQAEADSGDEATSDDIEYNTELGGEPGDRFDEGAAGERGGSSTWLIVAIILVVLVIAGVVAYFVFIKGGGKTAFTESGEGTEPGPVRPTSEPEILQCEMMKKPHSANSMSAMSDISTLMKAQSEAAGSFANLELDFTILLPASTIANTEPPPAQAFAAIVLPFIEGNWTFFFTYDGCTEGNGATYFSDSCYADINDFRARIQEVSARSTLISNQQCIQKMFAPEHKSNAKPELREVPVVGYIWKLTIDFQANLLMLELCEDEAYTSCKPFWTKEEVPVKSTTDFTSLEVFLHNGWSTPAQVGNKFSIDQYVNITDVCKLYKP